MAKEESKEINPMLYKDTGKLKIQIVPAYDFLEETDRLFSEYKQMLISKDPEVQRYLEIQDYDRELQYLKEKYGRTFGRLYLAFCDGEAAGCIGLRRMDGEKCEMKRLYVRPRFRGKQIGERLVRKIIQAAKEIGYQYMFLDTLPYLESAVHLYQKWGFYETQRYNGSPMENSIYMKKDLYCVINLRKRPEITDSAAEWFHDQWKIPVQEYRESMRESLKGKSAVPQWYLAMEDDRIIGGLGVIANDFHKRKDLTPNICAVYVEEDWRGQGIAGKLLSLACREMKEQGIHTLYLLTDHTSFYEKYDWEFLCMAQTEDGSEEMRVYTHKER